jgi:hypothetical protein
MKEQSSSMYMVVKAIGEYYWVKAGKENVLKWTKQNFIDMTCMHSRTELIQI